MFIYHIGLFFIIRPRQYTFIEILCLPITMFVTLYMKTFTRIFPAYLKFSYDLFARCDWLPVPFHYFQPIVRADMLPQNYEQTENALFGIDLNIKNQLDLLSKFDYNRELEAIALNEEEDHYKPYYRNKNFRSGDAEILYSMIRYYKPKRIIEIGSGFSTTFMLKAIEQNRKESSNKTELVCIEPFEQSWLEQLGINVIRKPVERLELSFFEQLSENDILFIDSSHVIRTRGDVVLEYLNIIPSLQKGVIVHCHDIFLPMDYPLKYIVEYRYFWNEQYILQALLSNSKRYKILLSLKFLAIHYKSEIEKCCPILKKENEKEGPASFWFQVVE
jgi:predicted O-methyltransferase YrrM